MRESLIFTLSLLVGSILFLQGTMTVLRMLRRRRARKRRLALYRRHLLNVRSAAIRLTFAVRATDDEGVSLRSADYLALVRALSLMATFERSPVSHKYKTKLAKLEKHIPTHLSGF